VDWLGTASDGCPGAPWLESMFFPGEETLGLPGREMVNDETEDWSVGGRDSAGKLVGMAEPCIKAPDAQLHVAVSNVPGLSEQSTY
jgi:hypothetical protein